MSYNETITFGGITLNVTELKSVRRQKQRKMVIGKKLVLINILGAGVQQWEIDITAVVTGSTLTELYDDRADIDALNDLETHAYVDGLHDGTYYMLPESLIFEDSGTRGNMSFIVNFRIIEE